LSSEPENIEAAELTREVHMKKAISSSLFSQNKKGGRVNSVLLNSNFEGACFLVSFQYRVDWACSVDIILAVGCISYHKANIEKLRKPKKPLASRLELGN
jgi:hypothetical protein